MPLHRLQWFEIKQLGPIRSLVIPVANIYAPIIRRAYPDVVKGPVVPMTKTRGALPLAVDEESEAELRQFLEFLGEHDLCGRSKGLDPSFGQELSEMYALDRNFTTAESGVYTDVGQLEYKAKWQQDDSCIAELGTRVANFALTHPTLRRSEAVIAVPGNPSKPFNLPDRLAAAASSALGIPLLVATKVETPQLKGLTLDAKASALVGKFAIPVTVTGKRVLLIDDVFQSGTTAWSVARAIRAAGAVDVVGLAAIKTWRDSDNV